MPVSVTRSEGATVHLSRLDGASVNVPRPAGSDTPVTVDRSEVGHAAIVAGLALAVRSPDVDEILVVTRPEYDAIVDPDPRVVYWIVEE